MQWMMKTRLAALVGLFAIFAGASVSLALGEPAATVHMQNATFSPANVTVHVGDTVLFVNDDVNDHTVTGKNWQSGNIASGKSWEYTFNEAGTYTYACDYHPWMKGSITVVSGK
jgi:plastocyanin